MDFFSRHWKTLVLFFLGPIVGSFFAYWYFQIRPTANAPTTPPEIGIGLAISLAITFLSSLLGLQISMSENTFTLSKKIEKTKNEFIEKQRDQLRSRVKIVELTGRDIDRMILEKIGGANSVRNTYVNLAEKMSRLPSSSEDALQQYSKFLSQDERHWIDVTTIQDINLGRYRNINIENLGKGSRHDVFIIDSKIDILNFIIIDKNNSPSDVFFGWVGESGEYFRVFWTNNQAMLEAFSGYFSTLRASAIEDIEIQYQESVRYKTKSDALIGRWLCVPQIERMTSYKMFRTYSILEISMERGNWIVKSDVYNSANGQRIRVIESDTAMSQEDNIFFEGVSRSVGGTQRNVTFGQLKLVPDYDDMIVGTYVAEDANTVSRFFSCRVDDTVSEKKYETIIPVIKKILSRRDVVRADDWG